MNMKNHIIKMKKFLPLFAVVALLSCPMNAQDLNEEWSTTITNQAGASYEDLAVVEPHENGVIAAGKSTSNVGYTMYVAQYDDDGEMIWETSFDTPGRSEFTHVTTDENGDYYLVGFEVQSAFFSRKIHIVKMNPDGDVLWQTEYSGPEDIHAWAKDIAYANGKLYICGIEDQPDGFDSGFVAQFNSNGNLDWGNDFNPTLGNDLTSITATADGNVTAVGYADAEFSLYAVQYDSEGNTNWTFPDTFEGEDEKWFSDIISDGEGNLYTQVTQETGFFEQSIFTQKRDIDFNLIWEHTFDSGEMNEGLSLALGSDESVYSFIQQDVSFDFHARVVKLDQSGNETLSLVHDIGDGSDFEIAVLNEEDQIYLAMETLDSYGVSTYDSDGLFIGEEIYEFSELNFVNGMVANENSVICVGTDNFSTSSSVFRLDASNLAEEYFITSMGEPLPDARPGKILTRGADIWVATAGDSGTDGTFTISKLDPSGNILWESSVIHPTSFPEFSELAADEDGNIVGAYYNGQGLNEGFYGIVKFDSDGNEVFDVFINDNPFYRDLTLCLDNDGNIFVAGYNSESQLMFLEHYDALGNFQWEETYQSPSTTFPFSAPELMQFTAQGKIVIASDHRGADNEDNIHLFQYDTDGNLEWDAQVSEQGGSLLRIPDMEIDPNGDIYLFGTQGSGFVYAKYDSNGTLAWNYSNNSSLFPQARSMSRDSQGNGYLFFNTPTDGTVIKVNNSGNFESETVVTTPSTGGFYYGTESAFIDDHLVILGDHLMAEFGTVKFQMVLNQNLDLLFAAVDSVETADIISSSLDANGNFYGVYMTGDLSLGQGTREGFVKKFTLEPLSTVDAPLSKKALKVYPNPSNGQFQIDLNLSQTAIFQVFLRDLTGRIVYQFPSHVHASERSKALYQIPRDFPTGVYLMELQSKDLRLIRKIVLD